MFNPELETKNIEVSFKTKMKIELFLRKNLKYKKITFEKSELAKNNPISKYQTEAKRREYYELYIDNLEFDLSVSKMGEFYTNIKVDSVFINKEFNLDIFKEILLKHNVVTKEENIKKIDLISYNWKDLLLQATKVLVEGKTKEMVLENLDSIVVPEIKERLSKLAKNKIFFKNNKCKSRTR